MKTNSGSRTILLRQLRFVGIGNSESLGGNKHHNSKANVEHFVSPRQAPSREHALLDLLDLDYDVNSDEIYLFSQTVQVYPLTTHRST